MKTENPYQSLKSNSFWKTAVSQRSMFDINELWDPKFVLSKEDKISTFGSCFAQHIGNALKSRGYNWLITETPPDGMSKENAKRFGYNTFSARTGNIYTTSLLLQWIDWALSRKSVPHEVWEKDGRFFDPFRPAIEPTGFKSEFEMRSLQNHAVSSFFRCIEKSNYLIFTLGLTESWFNEKGYEYPMCPGTIAGDFNKDLHLFKNQKFNLIHENLIKSIDLMKSVNPKLRFIFTVSPVPLTATMSGKHVLVATMESKSILRAVAGQLAQERPDIDYFPSYEIINSPVFRGAFFEQNQRNVNPYGVDFVMDSFFRCMSKSKDYFPSPPKGSETQSGHPVVTACDFEEGCEEAMLEVYSKEGGRQ